MKEERKTVTLDAYEEGAIIECLNKLRSDNLQKGECADFVSSLMLKIIHAPSKKARWRDEAR